MGKALIIFGSTTGNTEEMAEMVGKGFDGAGLETELKNVQDAEVEDLTGEHDLLLLGCPAYGDDTILTEGGHGDFGGMMNCTSSLKARLRILSALSIHPKLKKKNPPL